MSSAPLWALNAMRGQQLYQHLALEMDQRKAGVMLSSEGAEASEGGEEQANWWNDLLLASGVTPYYVNPDGSVVQSVEKDHDSKLQQGAVAVIPVHGTLMHDCWAYEEVFYGLVSSKRLATFTRDVQRNPKVAGAVFSIYSPGGMVNGTEALGRAVRELGAAKKTVAHVDSLAASAGYWLASQCGTIVIDGETTEVGSVGVMLSFLDVIPYLEALGCKYHELYPEESNKKNEAWRQLRTQNDPTLFKAELAQTAKVFADTVKAGRGARLKNTEAAFEGRVYAGTEAVTVGLADRIGDLPSCIQNVRTGTDGAGAPASVDPNKPNPSEAPVTDATKTTPTTTANTTRPMNLKIMLASLAAALFGTPEEATAETITAANAELKEKGISNVHFVDSAAFEAAQQAEARVSEAASATATVTAERDAAIAERDAARAELAGVNAGIQEAANALAITVEGEATALGAMTTAHQAANAEVTRLNSELATANTRITELEALGADDKKGAGAVNTEGDLRSAGVTNPALAAFSKEIEAEVNARG